MGFSQMMGKARYFLKTHKPLILGITGTVGVVGGTIGVGIASTKLEEKVDIRRQQVEEAKAAGDMKAVRKARMGMVGDVTRLYGPAVAVEAAGLGCMWYGGAELNKRNMALTAGIAAISASYADYRARVKDEYGAEADEKFYFGRDINGASAENHAVEAQKVQFSPGSTSRLFDRSNRYWNQQLFEQNILFLKSKQDEMNRRLHMDTFLTLNTVYDQLGFPPTDAGLVYGWSMDNPDGDQYVSFGIEDILAGAWRDWQYLDWNNSNIPLVFNFDKKPLFGTMKR